MGERPTQDPRIVVEPTHRRFPEPVGEHAGGGGAGEERQPVAKADPRDARFADPEWSSHPVFDFVKQAYLGARHARFAETMVENAEELDPHTREKARFYVKQIAGALSLEFRRDQS